MLDPAILPFTQQKGLTVKFADLRNRRDGWAERDDELDGRIGTVIACLSLGAGYVDTCTLRMHDEEEEEINSVPVDCVVPVTPQMDTEAVALHGPHKGHIVSIASIEDSHYIFYVYKPDGQAVHEGKVGEFCLFKSLV